MLIVEQVALIRCKFIDGMIEALFVSWRTKRIVSASWYVSYLITLIGWFESRFFKLDERLFLNISREYGDPSFALSSDLMVITISC